MPYTAEYNKLIEKEEGISKTAVTPRNLYKIHSYTYADGERKTLTGNKVAIVFVFGKDARNLFAVKLNDLTPKRFFRWLNTLKVNTPIDFDKVQELDETIIKSDKQGKKIFSTKIKGKPIYNNKKPVYRTYTIKGISSISKIYLKPEVLEQTFS
jgi:hypothetical protein